MALPLVDHGAGARRAETVFQNASLRNSATARAETFEAEDPAPDVPSAAAGRRDPDGARRAGGS
jgi:hypothetical protein